MLQAMQHYNMTNVAVVVTRHFGGVKLGVRGLMDAYAESVRKTIEQKKLRKLVQTACLSVEVSYEFNDILLSQIKSYLYRIKDTVYSDKIIHTLEIECSNEDAVATLLSQFQLQGKIKYDTGEKGRD